MLFFDKTGTLTSNSYDIKTIATKNQIYKTKKVNFFIKRLPEQVNLLREKEAEESVEMEPVLDEGRLITNFNDIALPFNSIVTVPITQNPPPFLSIPLNESPLENLELSRKRVMSTQFPALHSVSPELTFQRNPSFYLPQRSSENQPFISDQLPIRSVPKKELAPLMPTSFPLLSSRAIKARRPTKNSDMTFIMKEKNIKRQLIEKYISSDKPSVESPKKSANKINLGSMSPEFKPFVEPNEITDDMVGTEEDFFEDWMHKPEIMSLLHIFAICHDAKVVGDSYESNSIEEKTLLKMAQEYSMTFTGCQSNEGEGVDSTTYTYNIQGLSKTPIQVEVYFRLFEESRPVFTHRAWNVLHLDKRPQD